MWLLVLLLIWCAVSFYAGFCTPPRFWQYKSRVAFVVSLLMIAFVGYFQWREYRSTSELAALIEPVPDVTDVMYVPTPEELGAIANVLAATPGTTRFGGTHQERQATARDIAGMTKRYWCLTTKRKPEEVIDFYMAPGRLGHWHVKERSGTMLMLARGAESMMIVVVDDWGGPKVWYIYG